MSMQRRRSRALLLALATVLACVVAVGMWRFLGQPQVPSDASSSSTPVVSDQVEASSADSAQADAQVAESDGTQTDKDDAAAVADADYQQRVEEAQAADEAAGAGTSFEAGKALVTLADGATVDEVNAMLAGMDGVSTKVVSDEDISGGYLLVDVAPTTSVEAATAELEESEVVSAAQPNYLYQIMDETVGTVSDLMEQTSPLAATEPVTQLAADDAAAKTDAAATDAQTGADAATTDAATTDEVAAAAARQGAEAASTAATATEATGAEALAVTVQGVTLNDDYWPLQWALHDTTGKTASVHVDEAWTVQKTNKAVSVAIIDSGALTTHEDLNDNIVATYNSVTKGSDVTDNAGHGTHVAGIVSAESNNSTGVSGSSYDAGLVIVKAVSSNGYFYTDGLVEAYRWLIENAPTDNIKVVNMSLGGEGTPESDDALIKKIEEAKSKGILTVCAAGNSDTGLTVPYDDYPGDWKSALSVINLTYSSVDGTFLPVRSSGSNYNTEGTTSSSDNTKDVSAPGTNIISTTNDGKYGNMSGTSMASPCVAGVAALLFSANPDLTPDQVMADLETTATDLNGDGTGTPTGDNVGWDVYTGYGEVNAYKAVLSANNVSIAGEDAVLLKSTLDLDATVKEGTVASWAWSSADDTVATVNGDGVVTGAKAGTATITATATLSDGTTFSGSKTVTVIDASLSGPSLVGKGSTTGYSVTGGKSLAWTYSTTNASVAAIAEDSGVLTAQAVGTVTVTATSVAHPTIKVTKQVTVVDASISGDDAVLKGSASSSYSVAGASGHAWTWSVSSLGGAATIDASSGTLAATTVGKVKVTATSTENSDLVLTKTVTICTASISGYSYMVKGSSATFSASTNPTTSGTWVWSVVNGSGAATITTAGKLTATKAGTVTVKATSSLGATVTCAKTITISSRLTMYRLYNPNSGEHFYTSSSSERDFDVRAGWIYEGVGWYAPSTSSTPVYRLYNPYAGDHHYTTDASERDMLRRAGWLYEGVGWYSDDARAVAVWREYNPNAVAGAHNFTPSREEHAWLGTMGWTLEGIAWYGV